MTVSSGPMLVESAAAWARTRPNAVALASPDLSLTWAELAKVQADAVVQLAGLSTSRLVIAIAGSDLPSMAGWMLAAEELGHDVLLADTLSVVERALGPEAMAGEIGEAALGVAVLSDERWKSYQERDRNLVGLLTSGTSGHPKVAVHSERTLQEASQRVLNLGRLSVRAPLEGARYAFAAMRRFGAKASLRARRRTASYSAFPPSTIGGLSQMVQAVHSGSVLFADNRFRPTRAIELLEHGGFTTATMSPLLAERLLRTRRAREQVGPLGTVVNITLSGDRIDPKLPSAISTELGVGATCVFGMTELGGAAITDLLAEQDPLADGVILGRPLPYVEVGVAEDSWRVQRSGEGLLAARSPGMMLGYLDDPPLGPNAWVRSGDRIRIDGSNVLFRGRTDTHCVRAGQNVPRGKVEESFLGLDSIGACALVEVEGVAGGDIVLLYESAGGEIPLDALRQHAVRSLPATWAPRRFLCVPAIPLGPSGKVNYRAARECIGS